MDVIDQEHHQMEGALIDIQQLIYDALRGAPLAVVGCFGPDGVARSEEAAEAAINVLVAIDQEIDDILGRHGIKVMTGAQLEWSEMPRARE